MKRFFPVFLILPLVLGLADVAAAQGGATNVNVEARVLHTVALTVEQNIIFGYITQDDTHTIAANSEDAGIVKITATPNETILVTIPATVELENVDDTEEKLTFNSATPRYHTGADPEDVAAADLDDGSSTGGSFDMGANEEMHLFLGGSVTTASDQFRGTYNGVLAVTIAYDI